MRRVVLLGVMGAGKSTVGRALARQWGWRFVDFDREIERREGRTVLEIFREEGEDYFRRLEVALTEEVAGVWRVVLAPGGGWVTSAGVIDRLREDSCFVWLRASPEQVLARLRRSPEERPLLQSPDPRATLERVLAERERLYRRADLIVDTDGRAVESIAREIERGVGVGVHA